MSDDLLEEIFAEDGSAGRRRFGGLFGRKAKPGVSGGGVCLIFLKMMRLLVVEGLVGAWVLLRFGWVLQSEERRVVMLFFGKESYFEGYFRPTQDSRRFQKTPQPAVFHGED